MDFVECRASSTRARGQSHPVPFPDGSFSASSGLKSNPIQLGNIWSPFVAPNLALAWPCFAATHLTLHALVLGLECKSAVSIISTKTNLPPQASPVVVVSAVGINGDPIMRHFVECPLILHFHFALLPSCKKKDKKETPSFSKPDPITKKKNHHFSISLTPSAYRQTVLPLPVCLAVSYQYLLTQFQILQSFLCSNIATYHCLPIYSFGLLSPVAIISFNRIG